MNLPFSPLDWFQLSGSAQQSTLNHLQSAAVGAVRVVISADAFYNATWGQAYLQFILGCANRGINVMPILRSTYVSADWNYWNQFCRDVANTYGINGSAWSGHPSPSFVVAYEIWNEPNSSGPQGWNTGVDPHTYAAMVKQSYVTLAQLNSDYRTIVGGLIQGGSAGSPTRWEAGDFIAQIINNGASFHHCGVHAYAGTSGYDLSSTTNMLDRCRNVLNSLGSSTRQLWVNEFGLHSLSENARTYDLSLLLSSMDTSPTWNIGVRAWFPFYDAPSAWPDWGLVHSDPNTYSTFADKPALATWTSWSNNNPWLAI